MQRIGLNMQRIGLNIEEYQPDSHLIKSPHV